MLDKLQLWDQAALLFFNGMNSPFWDQVMHWISGKYSWLPLYLLIIAYLIFRFKWKSILIILLVVVLIIISDLTSVHLFKNVFQRLRPCHNPDISHLVHLVNNHCGGQYGFVSSHAANVFAVAGYTSLIIRNRYYAFGIIFWAILVGYSRIYLGVHYPGDVLGGAALGIGVGFFVYWLYRLSGKKLKFIRKLD